MSICHISRKNTNENNEKNGKKRRAKSILYDHIDRLVIIKQAPTESRTFAQSPGQKTKTTETQPMSINQNGFLPLLIHNRKYYDVSIFQIQKSIFSYSLTASFVSKPLNHFYNKRTQMHTLTRTETLDARSAYMCKNVSLIL